MKKRRLTLLDCHDIFPNYAVFVAGGPRSSTFKSSKIRLELRLPIVAAAWKNVFNRMRGVPQFDIDGPKEDVLNQGKPVLADSKRSLGFSVTNEIIIAIDDQKHLVLIQDHGSLGGHTTFLILKLLINAAIKDQAAGLLPRNHRSFAGKIIAEELRIADESAIRQAIRRARKDLSQADVALDGTSTHPNLIIESTSSGYRLNPRVRVVALDEFQQL
jgi:hypothetical protein